MDEWISSLCNITQNAQKQGLARVYVGSHWLTSKNELERAMGIEPKRTLLRSLDNTAFRYPEKTACDWRANFRVMRDNVGPRETTAPFAIGLRLSIMSSG